MQRSFTKLSDSLSWSWLGAGRRGAWCILLFFVCSLQTYAQTNVVTGRVTDAQTGEGLPGVNVLIKGTGDGTVTDMEGNFRLGDVSADDVLVFSFIGYEKKEEVVGTRSTIDVTLREDSRQLEEVVVVGYGTQTRGTITGAIGNVGEEMLRRTPAVTTSEALVGKVQGITARQGNGRPGGGANLQIRNMGEPLYIIDGVPADAGQFNQLGQDDVESISILKDASAAIYGLRAANGVILVTTKKGAPGRPKINVSSYYGVQNFTRVPQLANAYQYVRGQIEADMNQHGSTNWSSEELENWRQGGPGYESFDAGDFIFRDNVPQYQMNASASGGSENVNYYVSLTHLNEDAVIKDFGFDRTNLQANIEARLTEGLSVGTQISGRVENRHQLGMPGADEWFMYFIPFLGYYNMTPIERPYANDNPNYIQFRNRLDFNPATFREDVMGYRDDQWRAFKANLFAEYEFDFGLKARATYSHNFTTNTVDMFKYTYDAYVYDEQNDEYIKQGGMESPFRQVGTTNIEDRFAQLQLSYERQFGHHKVAAVGVYERMDSRSEGVITDAIPTNNHIPLVSFDDVANINHWIGVEARAGYSARMNYNYRGKYLVEVLGRYDGSFLFPAASRWGLFPGVSAGWRLSEESFIRDNIGSVLSELKLRGSYGMIGSDRMNNNWIFPPFSYMAGYNFHPTAAGSAVLDGSLVSGVRPRGLPVTNLSWITNINKNIGIDYGFWDNRITGQLDVFERVRRGIPVASQDVLLPAEVGYALPAENLNIDAHRGIEGSINYNGKTGAFDYSFGVNATLARRWDVYYDHNRRFENSWHEYRNSWQDRWANIHWGYQVVGRFQSQEEIDHHQVDMDGQGNRTMMPGDFIFKDVNGDGVINGMDERPIGYAEGHIPYFNFGINGHIAFKGFSLTYGFAGGGLQSITRSWEARNPFQLDGNSPVYLLEDRWHREDIFDPESAWVPGLYPAIRRQGAPNVSNSRHSDFWVTNVRYIRLRNIELGYDIPKSIIGRANITALRLFVNGMNLFSIDNMRQYGMDPELEWGNSLVYPPQSMVSGGFNLTF